MTTVKEILDQFNALFRYNKENVESIDIGDYTFNKAYVDNTEYIIEFINTENPDVWLRINDDRVAIILIQKINEDEVRVTSWRWGHKNSDIFPYEMWKPYTESERKPLPTED